MKALIIAALVMIMPIYAVAEETEQASMQDEAAVADETKAYYVEESDNDSQYFNSNQWQSYKGLCPLDDPTSLSYREEQERRARKAKRY